MFLRLVRTAGAVAASLGIVVLLTQRSENSGPPKQPNDYFHVQRSWPSHDIPKGAFAAALEQARDLARSPLRSSQGAVWQEAGPTNVGGRITAVAVDPFDVNRVWIGAADGGVFRTTTGGDDWTPLSDHFGSLSVGALAAVPGRLGVVYAGTGEANASGDSYDGIGILKTTDAGDTWDIVGLEDSQRIGRIAVDPLNPDRVYVAVAGGLFSADSSRGVYRSTDAGTLWESVLFVSDSTSAIDVVVDPTNGDVVYAAMWERMRGPDFRYVGGPTSGIWKSTDGGDSWTLQTSELPSGPDVGRIGLAIAPTSPSTVYAVYADDPGDFMGVYKTTDAGATWARRDNGFALSNAFGDFGWYFGNIRVDPNNANVVYTLGIRLYRSTNGGFGWVNVTNEQHVDMHDLWINPADSQHLISANDGGYYTTSTGPGSWIKKNSLPVTQFYAITVDPQNASRIYGGSQDNSTPRTWTGAIDDWDVLASGDGFTVVVDPTDSQVIYAEAQFGQFMKSTNGGADFASMLTGVDTANDRFNWHTPFVMDPSNHRTLYLGSQRVYQTVNASTTWVAISPDLTSGPGSGNLTFGTLTALAVAATDSNVVWAGADDGNVHVTTNGGTIWTNVSAGLPTRYVTRVTPDPTDTAVAYVTLSGYRRDEFLPHVFRTADTGTSWTDISSNLPEAPVNDIVVDFPDVSRLFVATDVGCYMSNDLGGSWEKLGEGLPVSVVTDLELYLPTRTLIAGTHGRSSFRLQLSDAVEAVPFPADAAGVRLSAARPNPSRGRAVLSFTLPRRSDASLRIHDVTGRLVRTLHAGPAEGVTSVTWDGRAANGRLVAPGVYFARLVTDEVSRSVKITRVR
jgi:photosystem II stability/assembly factor-like uncharacterized protein